MISIIKILRNYAVLISLDSVFSNQQLFCNDI